MRVSRKVKNLLVNAGLISAEDWTKAQESGEPVIEYLLAEGALEEGAYLCALGQSAGIAPLEISRVTPDPAALDAIPEDLCRENGILPLARNGDVLTVAIADPFDVLLLDDLKRLSRCQVVSVLSHPAAIREATQATFSDGGALANELLNEVQDASDETSNLQIEEEAEDIESAAQGDDAPAVKLVNVILLKALKDGASDIHIEPGDKATKVRFRVDGSLYDVMKPPKSLLPAISSRLKILAQLDIAERFSPQDGKFQIRFEGRQIDFRLSMLPVVGGEKAVMRILDTGNLALKLETMGYETPTLECVREAIHSPYGMMLVTGPTGSGKSTTLYSCVREVATPEVNVVTVEDPVEYRMDGINQVPVNPKRGLTFAGALRSILRQDPDVVLVGEIRDKETAEIAIKAALTGHLVLSTLHTNDAASTITRLSDMGIDPFMVSSSLLCVGAQRLARKLCKHCREPLESPKKELLLNVGFTESEVEGDLELYGPGPGCPRCKEGYSGRFAILETLSVKQELKRMIIGGASALELKAEAIRLGMLTLRRVGLLNAMRGITSIAEVLRVTMDDK